MKGFLQLVEEKEKALKPVVMSFGRFNPPTTGHMKVIDKVHEVAEKNHAKHVIVASHTQDSKKNPLPVEKKLHHLKTYSPNTHFVAASKPLPTMFHHAAKLSAAGHDHLIMVAGSDRVKEYHQLLHKYNGVKSSTGEGYHFKKIDVVSSGHRDADSEGTEGISGSKMREHAKNNDFSSFRAGVPHHVSDTHAKELMKDTRKGMGLDEAINRGMFHAIFISGGPGSGKDLLIREAIATTRTVELNLIQATQYLKDKQKLSEKTSDFRREAIRNRGPLMICGPADHLENINYVREELKKFGYESMMIFVSTTNLVSSQRNMSLSHMVSESIRQNRWVESQKNIKNFNETFDKFIVFENSGNIDTLTKEENIHEIYQTTKNFLDQRVLNESSIDWLERNGTLNINEKFELLFKNSQIFEKEKTKKTVRKSAGTDPIRINMGTGDLGYKFGVQSSPGATVLTSFPSEEVKYIKRKKVRTPASAQPQQTPPQQTPDKFGIGVGATWSDRTGSQMPEQISFDRFRKKYNESEDQNDMPNTGLGNGAVTKEPMETPKIKYGKPSKIKEKRVK